jgi:hypothetical protein
MKLVKYDAAVKALAECRRVDEVRTIRDQGIAIKVYAKIAKNRQLEADAAAIRIRAERRIGEMMETQAASVGKAKGHRFAGGFSHNPPAEPPSLREAGIDKNLAHRARKYARMGEDEFEDEVAKVRHKVMHRDDETEDEAAEEHVSTPEEFRTGYLIRVDQAAWMAHYKGPLKRGWAKEFAAMARGVAAKWIDLAERFENEGK